MTNNPAVLPDARALGRFGHHPDPVIDFEIEVEEIESITESARLGLAGSKHETDRTVLARRIELAMLFQVGGDPSCCAAKAKLRAIADATPPASDAAVYMLVPVVPTEAMYDAGKQHAGEHTGSAKRTWAAMLAAAPKVASDTGAGLREALRPFAFEGVTIPRGLPLDSYWLMDAITGKGITVGQVLAARAALATPTDATDGATGGGEVDDENAPLRNPPTSNGIRPLRRVATTPGGGLLEQAASLVYRIEAAGLLEYEGSNFERWKADARALAPELRRALKPAGDGGEA